RRRCPRCARVVRTLETGRQESDRDAQFSEPAIRRDRHTAGNLERGGAQSVGPGGRSVGDGTSAERALMTDEARYENLLVDELAAYQEALEAGGTTADRETVDEALPPQLKQRIAERKRCLAILH